MIRLILFLLSFALIALASNGTVVADSQSRAALPNVSVFDRNGKPAGVCGSNGRLPYLAADEFPITLRCMGYKETLVGDASRDTIFMEINVMALPEMVVEAKGRRVLHILAYVREYSSLSTYEDTVFLFREKMVDYMWNPSRNGSFTGWNSPRILNSRSYYRFTNYQGLDSVSDKFNNHFSWADWVGLAPKAELPRRLIGRESGTDTVNGKYSMTEVWTKDGDRVDVDIDVLADTGRRTWVPNLSAFFNKDLDFERFKIRFNYDNVVGNTMSPLEMTGYSFTIESNGRGRGMFMFNRVDDPFFVSTYCEVYIVDKGFVSVKEARRLEKKLPDELKEMAIFEAASAPELQQSILELIARVDEVDRDKIRLALVPDKRLGGKEVVKLNPGQQILKRLKGLVGLDDVNARRKWNSQWKEFRKERRERNKVKALQE
ncbi:MAG: hypothetical protein K2M06_07905 [Muribaculaceae bacterium]|nr:hypothetical protein [Muribaculaceae bacterium]